MNPAGGHILDPSSIPSIHFTQLLPPGLRRSYCHSSGELELGCSSSFAYTNGNADAKVLRHMSVQREPELGPGCLCF